MHCRTPLRLAETTFHFGASAARFTCPELFRVAMAK